MTTRFDAARSRLQPGLECIVAAITFAAGLLKLTSNHVAVELALPGIETQTLEFSFSVFELVLGGGDPPVGVGVSVGCGVGNRSYPCDGGK